MTTFIDLRRADVGAAALAELVHAVNAGVCDKRAHSCEPAILRELPGAAFVYWCPPRLRALFTTLQPLGDLVSDVAKGAYTTDDFRYLRLRMEVDSTRIASDLVECDVKPWVAYSKGGRFTRYVPSLDLVLNWRRRGVDLKAYISDYRGSRGWGYQWSAALNGHDSYFRPGITFPRRPHMRGAFQLMPSGCVFGAEGPVVFSGNPLAFCALLNSEPFIWLLHLLMARGTEGGQTLKYEVGYISSVPAPAEAAVSAGLGAATARAWSVRRSLEAVVETSHVFHVPALIQAQGVTLAGRASAWSARVSEVESELASIQAEIDDIAFGLYGIDGEDRARIEAESGTAPPPAATDEDAEAGEVSDDAEATDEGDDEEDGASADTATLATELISWAIGVAFGRFDVRHATGELPSPVEPGPFDPLPARSPGMCPDDTLAVDFLVDDPGHALDLSARVAEVFAKVFPADHEARLDEAVRLAGAADLPTFLRRTFFTFHLKRYSKSRRKAPIWWPLSTASGGYTVWLSWPRLTRDTLFRVADELKRQKVPFETRKLTSLKQDAGPNPSTHEKAVIAGQDDFVSELSALLEEVERVAPLWNPVHDDGVILHFALLWRVVRDTAWQKECRAAWEKLAKGDFDWAHVAMHLWPERVAPKCRTDRSLAIAHGLEDAFWVEVAGKWQARADTDAPLAAAIAERSSAAVKAALRALESAPSPSRGGRGRRGR